MASLNDQPIAQVEWVDRTSIGPNDYNPNHQPPPEHKLLKVSILEDGWTQPIVVFDDGSGDKPAIVDGEHRWRCSADKDIAALTNGKVPIVRIVKDRSSRIMSTVRHNRARGNHDVTQMSQLIRELFEAGNDMEQVCFLLGMEDEEVNRLAESAGLPTIVSAKHTDFTAGWIPTDK